MCNIYNEWREEDIKCFNKNKKKSKENIILKYTNPRRRQIELLRSTIY